MPPVSAVGFDDVSPGIDFDFADIDILKERLAVPGNSVIAV
jgi:hypothetical protein